MAEDKRPEDSATEEGEVEETEEKATTESRDIVDNKSTTQAGDAPPLPDEPAPEDDGWAAHWSQEFQRHCFYNRYTGVWQWENPRVADAAAQASAGASEATTATEKPKGTGAAGGYNPAIHGNYDPNADYAIAAREAEELEQSGPTVMPHQADDYTQTAQFNRFTGRFQNPDIHPNRTTAAHTDEAKSNRQMNAFFDVEAASSAHGGRSLKAERAGQKITKKQLKEYKEKRRNKKEEKRRAWLMD